MTKLGSALFSRGGGYIESNVRTAHINCNKRRGNRGSLQPALNLDS
jgi:hypothetical protein